MTPQEQFWKWFVQHEQELLHLQGHGEESILDHLAAVLQEVDADLTFEFGPAAGRREFVISAGGLKRAFPAVTSLVRTAPNLERWKVTAFRPRRPLGIVQFRGKRIDSRSVQFSLLDNGKTAGIYLFIPQFHENDVDLKQIGYLLLDETLGEYDVETRLGLIKMFPPEAETKLDRYPLRELPGYFDQLISRLEGRLANSN